MGIHYVDIQSSDKEHTTESRVMMSIILTIRLRGLQVTLCMGWRSETGRYAHKHSSDREHTTASIITMNNIMKNRFSGLEVTLCMGWLSESNCTAMVVKPDKTRCGTKSPTGYIPDLAYNLRLPTRRGLQTAVGCNPLSIVKHLDLDRSPFHNTNTHPRF